MRFGRRLWICPSAHPIPDEAQAPILLDPGLAFGTGSHPTTALCLEAIDAIHPEGCDVIDYGCGSGVLGIAALVLGARRCWALDIDPQALVATRDNAQRNQVAERLEVTGDPATLPGAGADLVVANILAGPLLALLPRLAGLVKEGGVLVLSGVLASQAGALRDAYAAHFEMASPRQRDDWVCLVGQRRAVT
jgi:ribosomal protein L11 methyltransferase